MTTPTPDLPSAPVAPTPASIAAGPVAEQGWGKLALGLAAFLLLPTLPQFRALLPIDETMVLVVPALAACSVVGWWAGGRVYMAAAWIGLTWLAIQVDRATGQYDNLARGWTLVLAGAFGFVCLLGSRRPLFQRAIITMTVSVALAGMMSVFGPVSGSDLNNAVRDELARRNAQTMGALDSLIGAYPKEWNQLVTRVPRMGELPAEADRQLRVISRAGELMYPSLLALESVLALAIAWSLYHRLARTRLGPPLGQLREFRFNDQLVWGLIIGIAIVFLPKLASARMLGRNLLVFFGAIYAIRGLGVLSFFMAPGALAVTATVGFAMFLVPVLNAIAALGFVLLGIAAFGLGLGDTWADWRNRPKQTTTTP